MKKIILSLLLIASCAFARVDSDDDRYFHAHRGFYFSVNSGFVYTYVRNTLHDYTSEGFQKSTSTFNGFLSYEEIRLGGSIANVASVYAVFGVGYGTGAYEDEIECEDCRRYSEGSFEEDDDEDIRLLFGVGGEFYPIQEKESPAYGLFFGITAGFTIDNVFFTDHYFNEVYDEVISDGFANLFARFEVGKEWWFGRRWSFGVALNYTIGSMSETYSDGYYDGEMSFEDEESFANHTFGLTLRLTH